MVKDLTVILQDHPGTLADLGEILGKAAINIEGMCAIICQGQGITHMLVEDSPSVRHVLEAKGIKVAAEREVLVKEIEDRPGALGEVTHKLANAGVNIEVVYLATKTRLVIGVDNLEKARSAI